MTRDTSLHSPSSGDHSDLDPISTFRLQTKQAKQHDTIGWDLTRKLVEPSSFPETLQQLKNRIQQSECIPLIKEKLLAALPSPDSPLLKSNARVVQLKELTGLTQTKAIRSLCLYFGLADQNNQDQSQVDPLTVEKFIQANSNPYQWLLRVNHPSLLDLGAGDLSFEEELIDQYLPPLKKSNQLLTLHALDRLQPGSQFGGVYHVSKERLTGFAQYSPAVLRFRFWAARDMLDLSTPREFLHTYSIVTCHAPATPTFAYEPSRLSERTIQDHLKQTKGQFKTVRIHGEEALEVNHRSRTLTFPSWKFAIRGPLALLDLMARRGQLCIMSAIDAEVFWEILAQLVEDETMRPSNIIFSPENVRTVFNQVYEVLSSLREGERCSLSDLIALRTRLEHVLTPKPQDSYGYRFRYIEVRRGAVFADMPSSFTARQFSKMTEEELPWCLILVPEQLYEKKGEA